MNTACGLPMGHPPGAVFCVTEDELESYDRRPGSAPRCRRGPSLQAHRPPMRNPDTMCRSCTRHDWTEPVPRAWWVLTAAGIANVRILDGGLPAWRSAGGSIDRPGPQLGKCDCAARRFVCRTAAHPNGAAKPVRGGVTLSMRAYRNVSAAIEPVMWLPVIPGAQR